jgi:hypothetical protein
MQRWGWVGVVLMLLTCVAAHGADLPQFQFTYGQPAIAYADSESGSYSLLPLAVDASHVYLCARDVWVFDRSGSWLSSWPVSTRGFNQTVNTDRPSRATDISVGFDGLIYVLEANRSVVHRFDAAGRFIGTRGGVGDNASEFPKDFIPQQLAAARDGSLSFLSRKEIRRYRWDGLFLNGWTIPSAEKPEISQVRILATAPDNSVWVLRNDSKLSGDIVGMVRSRLLHYSPEGKELAVWDAPSDATDLAIDPQGNVWTLHHAGYRARLEKRESKGELLLQVPIEVRRVAGFTISRDGHIFLATQQPMPKPNIYRLSAIAFSIEERDLEGKLLHSFGDFPDLRARGAILQATSFAATPQGDVYVRTPDLSPGQNYVSHYDSEGRMLEVIDTDRWPAYNPATGKVELRQRPYQTVDARGNGYTAQVQEPEFNAAVRRYVVSLSIYSPEDESIARITVLDFVAEVDEWLSGPPQLCYGPDGRLHLALVRTPHVSSAPQQGTLEVYTLTPDNQILCQWTDPAWGNSWLRGFTIDEIGHTYLACEGEVRVYIGAGIYVGRIGTVETTSPVQAPSAMQVDATGRLRILDASSPGPQYNWPALNRILVFGGK